LLNANKRLHRLENLDLARNLAMGEGVNKLCCRPTQKSVAYLFNFCYQFIFDRRIFLFCTSRTVYHLHSSFWPNSNIILDVKLVVLLLLAVDVRQSCVHEITAVNIRSTLSVRPNFCYSVFALCLHLISAFSSCGHIYTRRCQCFDAVGRLTCVSAGKMFRCDP